MGHGLDMHARRFKVLSLARFKVLSLSHTLALSLSLSLALALSGPRSRTHTGRVG